MAENGWRWLKIKCCMAIWCNHVQSDGMHSENRGGKDQIMPSFRMYSIQRKTVKVGVDTFAWILSFFYDAQQSWAEKLQMFSYKYVVLWPLRLRRAARTFLQTLHVVIWCFICTCTKSKIKLTSPIDSCLPGLLMPRPSLGSRRKHEEPHPWHQRTRKCPPNMHLNITYFSPTCYCLLPCSITSSDFPGLKKTCSP